MIFLDEMLSKLEFRKTVFLIYLFKILTLIITLGVKFVFKLCDIGYIILICILYNFFKEMNYSNAY